ncbi:MAG: hypothetical protein KDK36_13745, partial [Leptospiraceae bacterium]|nr:hypothetical protein [Leptospiraceae bacterium]
YNYSKSNPQINCSSANINGCNGKTLEVGKGIPTDQIFNMAGNVPEWTNDWVGECGKNCEGPQCLNVCLKNVSVCSGKFPCGKLNQKVVKGGGYNLPGENSNISSRMILDISGEKKHIGARCVSDTPYLTNAPAWIIKKPLPEPQSLDLPQVTDNERKILHELKEYDKLDKPFCDKPYTSPANCRDPVSYVKPNEARNYLFADYVKNLRGGYVGVAADANYSYIAQARSEWVWLMDFDFVIFNLHRIIKVFVLESETPGEFIEKFNPKNKPSSMALIEKVYRDHPDFSIMKTKVMDRYGASLYEHYKSISKPSKENGEFGWLRNPKAYSYIRMLHRKGRISIHGGDLLKDKTLFSIGESAKKLGVKIRIFYPSNAEEFWAFNENFKRNVLNLPFDEASVVLRTVHEYPWHVNDRKGGHAGFWHYVVHGAYNYQKKLQLPNYSGIQDFKNERIIPTDMRDFSTIHLPGNIPEGIKGN